MLPKGVMYDTYGKDKNAIPGLDYSDDEFDEADEVAEQESTSDIESIDNVCDAAIFDIIPFCLSDSPLYRGETTIWQEFPIMKQRVSRTSTDTFCVVRTVDFPLINIEQNFGTTRLHPRQVLLNLATDFLSLFQIQMQQRVGKGQWGSVFCGVDLASNKPVAIKVQDIVTQGRWKEVCQYVLSRQKQQHVEKTPNCAYAQRQFLSIHNAAYVEALVCVCLEYVVKNVHDLAESPFPAFYHCYRVVHKNIQHEPVQITVMEFLEGYQQLSDVVANLASVVVENPGLVKTILLNLVLDIILALAIMNSAPFCLVNLDVNPHNILLKKRPCPMIKIVNLPGIISSVSYTSVYEVKLIDYGFSSLLLPLPGRTTPLKVDGVQQVLSEKDQVTLHASRNATCGLYRSLCALHSLAESAAKVTTGDASTTEEWWQSFTLPMIRHCTKLHSPKDLYPSSSRPDAWQKTAVFGQSDTPLDMIYVLQNIQQQKSLSRLDLVDYRAPRSFLHCKTLAKSQPSTMHLTPCVDAGRFPHHTFPITMFLDE